MLSTTRARVLIAVALCLALSSAGYAAKARILVAANVAPDLADLSKTYPDLELVPAKNDEMAQKIVDCDAVVGIGPGPKLAEILKAGKNLKWIQASSAGAEEFVAIPELVSSSPSCSPTRRSCSGPASPTTPWRCCSTSPAT